jgi:hypothetical protein
LEKLMFEVVAEAEEAAQHTAQVLGFVPVGVLPGQVRDYCNQTHDLIIMERAILDTSAFDEGEGEEHRPVF